MDLRAPPTGWDDAELSELILYDELNARESRLFDVAGLTPEERRQAVQLFARKVGRVPGREPYAELILRASAVSSAERGSNQLPT